MLGSLVICLMSSGVAAVKPLKGSSLSTQADRGRAAPPGASARRDCPDARRGLAYYRHQAAWWRSKMGQERVGTVSRESHVRQGASQSCPHIRLWASRWRDRAHRAQRAFERWYAYAWQDWLPSKWVRVFRCETGIDWRWDSGTYQGAPGFYFGTWDAYKPRGYPAEAYQATPRQQFVVAERVRRAVGYGAWGCGGR